LLIAATPCLSKSVLSQRQPQACELAHTTQLVALATQTISRKLLKLGYSPDQVLDIHRGGKRQQRILLRDAAQQGEM
jgi:hypothetical protein